MLWDTFLAFIYAIWSNIYNPQIEIHFWIMHRRTKIFRWISSKWSRNQRSTNRKSRSATYLAFMSIDAFESFINSCNCKHEYASALNRRHLHTYFVCSIIAHSRNVPVQCTMSKPHQFTIDDIRYSNGWNALWYGGLITTILNMLFIYRKIGWNNWLDSLFVIIIYLIFSSLFSSWTECCNMYSK